MNSPEPKKMSRAPKTQASAKARKPRARPQSVQPCDFRSAGRLSNENVRALTALHETFARRVVSALDAHLGTGLAIKVLNLEQRPIQDHIASVAPLSYIVPFSLGTMPTTVMMEFDIDLVFPMIELLLGGTGIATSGNVPRELSEIEEEIMQDVISLIARQAENAWRIPHMSLAANRRIKPAVLQQYCPANDKVTIARFEMEIAGTVGMLQLVFPSASVAVLLNQIKEDQPQKKAGLRFFPTPNIRERILDCDVTLTSAVPRMKVAVRDLIAIEQGCVLKFRAPVRTPGMLIAEGMDIFEAMPVRNGAQKAAQLFRRIPPTAWGRGQGS